MKTIEIKSKAGNVLFSYSCVNNTIKITLNQAIKSGANLRHADLSYADLSYADLSLADLYKANLSHANLYKANLSHANLYKANLSHANLRHADLSYADLSLADLSGADLSFSKIQTKTGEIIIVKKINILNGLYTYICACIIDQDDKHWIKLGCHIRTISDWESDFWNNPLEFPNDDSEKSNMRLFAYQTCKNWFNFQK